MRLLWWQNRPQPEPSVWDRIIAGTHEGKWDAFAVVNGTERLAALSQAFETAYDTQDDLSLVWLDEAVEELWDWAMLHKLLPGFENPSREIPK